MKMPGSLITWTFTGGEHLTFMNKGMQSKKQRMIVVAVIAVVLVTFLFSIVAMSIW